MGARADGPGSKQIDVARKAEIAEKQPRRRRFTTACVTALGRSTIYPTLSRHDLADALPAVYTASRESIAHLAGVGQFNTYCGGNCG